MLRRGLCILKKSILLLQEMADHVIHHTLTVGHTALRANVLTLHTLGYGSQVR